MFTGIVEGTGRIEERVSAPNGVKFSVSAGDALKRLTPGDSIAVSGVCLTVEQVSGGLFECTAVDVTLSRTTLGQNKAGDRVNLELAATPTTALGGHLVQGHVDGVGRVASFEEVQHRGDASELEGRLLTVEIPDDLVHYVVEKGSIAIDGVSLTIASVDDGGRITIAIVPHTLEKTIVGQYRPGTPVNVEIDIIAKYVKHYMEQGDKSSWFGRMGSVRER